MTHTKHNTKHTTIISYYEHMPTASSLPLLTILETTKSQTTVAAGRQEH